MGAFDPPSLPARVLASPLLFVLRPVHALLAALRPPPYTRAPAVPPVRVVCLADTHTLAVHDVPDGHLLVHAGDLANAGSVAEIQRAVGWLNSLPHAHKFVVAGNHDAACDTAAHSAIDWGAIHYLQNTSVTVAVQPAPDARPRSFTVHGVPQVPQLVPDANSAHHAFQYPPSARTDPWPHPIPPATDILVSHSPPLHHRDVFPHCVGCPFLLAAAWRTRPALHVFGHAHAGRGVEPVYYDAPQRALERMAERRREPGYIWERGKRSAVGWLVYGGWWRDIFSVWWAWRDALAVVWGVGKAIVWTRIWGGQRALGQEGWMVNAACMDPRGSGTLTGGATVIEL
ncbi:hypothetical protein LOZ13_006745 [Ophidiomyces ophidiicola]|nr:hypothetical protein LOZ13_006745 [Ophidiomyces ophidiicola]